MLNPLEIEEGPLLPRLWNHRNQGTLHPFAYLAVTLEPGGWRHGCWSIHVDVDSFQYVSARRGEGEAERQRVTAARCGLPIPGSAHHEGDVAWGVALSPGWSCILPRRQLLRSALKLA